MTAHTAPKTNQTPPQLSQATPPSFPRAAPFPCFLLPRRARGWRYGWFLVRHHFCRVNVFFAALGKDKICHKSRPGCRRAIVNLEVDGRNGGVGAGGGRRGQFLSYRKAILRKYEQVGVSNRCTRLFICAPRRRVRSHERNITIG